MKMHLPSSVDGQLMDFSNSCPQTETNQNFNSPPEPKQIEDENAGPITINDLGSNRVENDSEEEKEDESQHNSKINDEMSESIMQIDMKFCTICTIEQPLRAKHCRHCNFCVALYDHHCPWMGNCIGERNRFNFWWYLLVECIMLNWTLYILACNIEDNNDALEWAQNNGLLVTCMVVVGFFSVMVTFLLIFHSYLIANNKTTWEQLSWDKISYLSKWPKKHGSPFTFGLVKNIHYYCCKPLPKAYTLWAFPNKIPN